MGLALSASAALARPAYTLVATVPLGAPDRWDYVTYDAGANRVYVAHGDRVTLVDPDAGTVVGQVEGVPGGTHGIAISRETGQGFTDDGKAGLAVAFDPKTLKIVRRIPAAPDADAIAIDGSSKHIFVVEGDSASITVIDPATDAGIATIKVGEKLEFAVSDDAGSLFVAGEEKGDLVRIDTAGNRVVAHYPGAGCTSPHGLAIDKAAHRLFMGCANGVMLVFDGSDGHVLATLPIGRGNDAIAYDPVRRRVFSSNGADGTISVIQQASADHYVPLEPIATKVSGRTMSLDPQTGRLFVAAATTTPAPTPGGRPRPVPGSLGLLIFSPGR
ncbi:YncE family protein [Sphingomonas morindae]|uniref:YncE family protein n=1 Tax=Sphingomonas morindae TaxID=1541170 RepID=A0ABY4X6Q1_9SPHN|nr:YncE family protein [Sphingomonas morindae]USI72525.1 YncE family protein [Sphingomonas morindae]